MINPMNEVMEKISKARFEQEAVIVSGLLPLRDGELESLMEIMGQVQGRTTEEKLLKALSIVWGDQLSKLDAVQKIIKEMPCELMKFFVGLYAEEFNRFHNGSCQFDNDPFRAAAKSEIDQRKGHPMLLHQ